MRIGIVGLGSIAHRVYLPLLCNRQDVEIAGLMSRSTATVTQAGRVYRIDDVFTDLGDLLARKPDLVFVHAPTVAHAEIVMACLSANAAVYVDKPLAYNLTDSEEMASRAAAGGLLLAVGFNRRFAPMYLRARDWVTALATCDSPPWETSSSCPAPDGPGGRLRRPDSRTRHPGGC
jgi:virulence factor